MAAWLEQAALDKELAGLPSLEVAAADAALQEEKRPAGACPGAPPAAAQCLACGHNGCSMCRAEARAVQKEEQEATAPEDHPSSFPPDARLLPWDPKLHAPCVGLINPRSGGWKGASILQVCGRTEYFRERVFSTADLLQHEWATAGLRARLEEAKQQAQESSSPSCRPRLVVGGGDGTASLALRLVFQALMAEPREEGAAPCGGFIWTDEEMEKYFPALVQMPLGTGNDLAGVLGWGRRYPGYLRRPWRQGDMSLLLLQQWFDEALSFSTPLANFDVWGFMPPPGSDAVDVKVCEMDRMEHATDSLHYIMRPAGPSVPFLVLLYASYGFSAHVVTRFEQARTSSQLGNLAAYARISASLLLGSAKRPRQLRANLEGVSVDMLEEPSGDEESGGAVGSRRYFPPRGDRQAGKYHEVGFVNLPSFRGGTFHGGDHAPCRRRCCPCCVGAQPGPVNFGDGQADFFREKGLSTWLKSGSRLKTSRAKAATFHFEPSAGQGIFFQYDGEGRFVFHPRGEAWRMDVQHVLTVPVAVRPRAWPQLQESLDDGPVSFRFVGLPSEVERVKARVRSWVRGELAEEFNASPEEIVAAGLPLGQEFDTRKVDDMETGVSI